MLSRSDTKRLALAAIADQLRDDPTATWDRLRATFPEVATTSFYRWVALVKKAGVPPIKPKQRAEERDSKRRKKTQAVVAERVPGAPGTTVMTPAVLPSKILEGTIPTLNDVMGFGLFDVARKLEGCVVNAQDVINGCRQGQNITNPDLLLRASDHLRKVAETSAKIMEMAWDIKRTEMFHHAIFRRIKDRDPELVKLILEDMRAVSIEMGMAV